MNVLFLVELREQVISEDGKTMDSSATQLVGFKCKNSTKKDGLRTQILKHRTNSQ